MTCFRSLRQYSIEPRTRKYVKGCGFLSFLRKYKKQLLDTGQNAATTASEKVVYKAGENIGNKILDAGEYLGNKIDGTGTKSNDDNTEKKEPVEEIIIPSEKRDEILTKLRKVL